MSLFHLQGMFDMKEYELSKFDFEALDRALEIALKAGDLRYMDFGRMEKLKDLFAKAHSATLLIEEE